MICTPWAGLTAKHHIQSIIETMQLPLAACKEAAVIGGSLEVLAVALVCTKLAMACGRVIRMVDKSHSTRSAHGALPAGPTRQLSPEHWRLLPSKPVQLERMPQIPDATYSTNNCHCSPAAQRRQHYDDSPAEGRLHMPLQLPNLLIS